MIQIPRDDIINCLDEVGWIQGSMSTEEGVCLFGALRRTLGPDAFLVERVWEWVGRDATWNDAESTTLDDVKRWVAVAPEVKPADLEYVFGPNWWAVARVVHRAALINTRDRERLAEAMRHRIQPAWNGLFRDVRMVVEMLPEAPYWTASMRAAAEAADEALPADMVEDYAWISGVTAAVVAVDHLFRRPDTGLNQTHRAMLLEPWYNAIGHPL